MKAVEMYNASVYAGWEAAERLGGVMIVKLSDNTSDVDIKKILVATQKVMRANSIMHQRIIHRVFHGEITRSNGLKAVVPPER